MARITDEQKIQINELYYENHNKALTARILGISAASVSKYIIPNYTPAANREPIPEFTKEPIGCKKLFDFVLQNGDCSKLQLSDEEKIELSQMQQNEIY